MPPEHNDRARTRPHPGDIRERLPGRDAGPAGQVTGPSFTVQVWFRDAPTAHEELLHETARQMADFAPRFQWDLAGRAVVTLQVTATDLWVAVLLAMGAVTGAGHQPERIEAMLSAEPQLSTVEESGLLSDE